MADPIPYIPIAPYQPGNQPKPWELSYEDDGSTYDHGKMPWDQNYSEESKTPVGFGEQMVRSAIGESERLGANVLTTTGALEDYAERGMKALGLPQTSPEEQARLRAISQGPSIPGVKPEQSVNAFEEADRLRAAAANYGLKPDERLTPGGAIGGIIGGSGPGIANMLFSGQERMVQAAQENSGETLPMVEGAAKGTVEAIPELITTEIGGRAFGPLFKSAFPATAKPFAQEAARLTGKSIGGGVGSIPGQAAATAIENVGKPQDQRQPLLPQDVSQAVQTVGQGVLLGLGAEGENLAELHSDLQDAKTPEAIKAVRERIDKFHRGYAAGQDLRRLAAKAQARGDTAAADYYRGKADKADPLGKQPEPTQPPAAPELPTISVDDITAHAKKRISDIQDQLHGPLEPTGFHDDGTPKGVERNRDKIALLGKDKSDSLKSELKFLQDNINDPAKLAGAYGTKLEAPDASNLIDLEGHGEAEKKPGLIQVEGYPPGYVPGPNEATLDDLLPLKDSRKDQGMIRLEGQPEGYVPGPDETPETPTVEPKKINKAPKLTPDEHAAAATATGDHPNDVPVDQVAALVDLAGHDPTAAQELVNAHPTDDTLGPATAGAGQPAAGSGPALPTGAEPAEETPPAAGADRSGESARQQAGSPSERSAGAPAQPEAAGAVTVPHGTITPEAKDLLDKVDQGGVPGFITNNLRRIATENGVEVTGQTTPNDIVDALRKRQEAAKPAPLAPEGAVSATKPAESATFDPATATPPEGAKPGDPILPPSAGETVNKDGLPVRTGENVGLVAGNDVDGRTTVHSKEKPDWIWATHTDPETGATSLKPYNLLASDDKHERDEEAEMQAGKDYYEAHRVATELQHHRDRQLGFDPNEIEQLRQPWNDAAAHEARARGNTTNRVGTEPYRVTPGGPEMRQDGEAPDNRFVLDTDGNKYTSPVHGKLLKRFEVITAKAEDGSHVVIDANSGKVLATGKTAEKADEAAAEMARNLGAKRLQKRLEKEPPLSQQQLREQFKERYPEARIGAPETTAVPEEKENAEEVRGDQGQAEEENAAGRSQDQGGANLQQPAGAEAEAGHAQEQVKPTGRRRAVMQDERLQDPVRRAELERMSHNAGWAQLGGRLQRAVDESKGGESDNYGMAPQSGDVTGLTSWMPNEPWFGDVQRTAGLPKNTEGRATRAAVKKALAGEPLTVRETRHVQALLDEADARQTEAAAFHEEGINPTAQDLDENAMVQHAMAIDPDAVERASVQFENDDAAFMDAVRRIADEHAERLAQEDYAYLAGEGGQAGPRTAGGEVQETRDRGAADAENRPAGGEPTPGGPDFSIRQPVSEQSAAAGEPGATTAKPGTVKKPEAPKRAPTKPLSKIRVRRVAINEDTGKRMTIREPADKALEDIHSHIKIMQDMLQCLAS
jgi:hypothetical protein